VPEGPGVRSASSPMLRLPPADHPPLDQLTRALVPQALGRAPAQEPQEVGSDEVIATQLGPETRSVLTIAAIVLSEINGRLSYAGWRSEGVWDRLPCPAHALS
jgi:hypothetical protein